MTPSVEYLQRKQLEEETQMAQHRTLEEQLKFDHGLKPGSLTLVGAKMDGRHTRKILVEISPRGIVRALAEPLDTSMYSSWRRVKGDENYYEKNAEVIVWGARCSQTMAAFEGAPKVIVDLNHMEKPSYNTIPHTDRPMADL